MLLCCITLSSSRETNACSRGSIPLYTTSRRSSLEIRIALCIFKFFGNLLPKGEKCIDHRLRGRVLCFSCLSLLLFGWYFCACSFDTLYVCVWDTCMIMCLIIFYFNVCLDDIIFYIPIWSFTLLGDECMFLISIILSAPPRCMWHGRVTHDPNRLCIRIQKKILNNAQI